jgi:predicted component of type VI protein secretion system
MNELNSDAKALVNAARDEVGLPPEQRARLRARVLSAVSAGSASILGSLFAKAAAAKALGISLLTWGTLGAAVAAGGTSYVLTHRSASHSEMVVHESAAPRGTEPVVATTPAAPVPTITTAASDVEHEPRQSRSRAVDSKVRAAPSPSADSSFAEDARLLRDVRTALAAGQRERALSLLEAREANAAPGVFSEEREAAKIVTLCGMGRPEGRAAASRFFAAHGASPLAERVRRACPR